MGPKGPKYHDPQHATRIVNDNSRSAGTAAGWGLFGGIVAVSFFEPTSLLQKDVLAKLPVVGKFWQDKLDAKAKKD